MTISSPARLCNINHPAETEYEGDNKMGIIVAYTLLALIFLALSSGLYKPKRWHDLTDRHVKILKIGCFFGFLVIMANLVGTFL